ncbi:MAG: hypothetical protein CVU84_14180 [Firmicutes bacterium HGW-Firmicutes-1]|jgi:fucose 4-O-acetylase-like acetyltransferase|nr:MAG: hypothetical protein CVU84_14180 [Firmicutes bacterium HGW-Firmicutes-1]
MEQIVKKLENRDIFIDYLKGLAIFLVVWGHTIQFALDSSIDFFLNPVFIVIYSFHMPLFMFVSGYLFMYSIKNRDIKTLIKSKFFQLIIPIITWSFVYKTLYFVVNYYRSNGISLYQQVMEYLIGYLKDLPEEFWYLWVVFYCTIIVSIIQRYFKDKLIAYFAIFAILLILPDNYILLLLKFMYPYFVAGYLFHKNKGKELSCIKDIKPLAMLAFPILLFFWKKDFYVYTTGMSLYVGVFRYRVFIILYRYLTGFVGVVFVMEVVKTSLKYLTIKGVTYIGKYTLGIYIIQYYLTYRLYVLPDFIADNQIIYNMVFTPVISIVIIIISLIAIKILQKTRITNRLFLGSRVKSAGE